MPTKFLNKKGRDLLLLCFFIVIARFLSLALNVSYLLSLLFFFGIPAAYLSLRANKGQIKKAFVFASLCLIPTVTVDILAVFSRAWILPETVFPFRLFQIIPLEDLIWAFLMVYLLVLVYEYFLDKGENLFLVKKPLKYCLLFLVLSAIFSISLIYLKPGLLYVPYFYLAMGLVFTLAPTLLFMIFYPKLISKFFKAGILFFLLLLVFELTGLILHHWEFPGPDFIGWINIFGQRFPIEEFIFFVILFSSAALSYYEFLYDDRK